MPINFAQTNDRIENWGSETKDFLIAEMLKLNIRHSAHSQSPKAATQSLKDRYRETARIINRISYQIPKHMIYVHKGVGRGTTAAMAGQTNRKAKPWFNPVIDSRINGLADIVAEELGSGIINNLLIK